MAKCSERKLLTKCHIYLQGYFKDCYIMRGLKKNGGSIRVQSFISLSLMTIKNLSSTKRKGAIFNID